MSEQRNPSIPPTKQKDSYRHCRYGCEQHGTRRNVFGGARQRMLFGRNAVDEAFDRGVDRLCKQYQTNGNGKQSALGPRLQKGG